MLCLVFWAHFIRLGGGIDAILRTLCAHYCHWHGLACAGMGWNRMKLYLDGEDPDQYYGMTLRSFKNCPFYARLANCSLEEVQRNAEGHGESLLPGTVSDSP